VTLRKLASVVFSCALCLIPAACGSGTLIAANASVNDSTYLQKAGLAAQSLQTWYNSASGLYASPASCSTYTQSESVAVYRKKHSKM